MLECVTRAGRPQNVFEGIADTRDDLRDVPQDCAYGSMIYIEDEDLYLIKCKNGTWHELPGWLFPDPKEPDTLENRRKFIIGWNEALRRKMIE